MKNYIKQLISSGTFRLIMERARLKKENAQLIEENGVLIKEIIKLKDINKDIQIVFDGVYKDMDDKIDCLHGELFELKEQNEFLLKQLNDKELEPIKF